MTSYEGSGDAGIVIPISVGAGLKGNEQFKYGQLLLFHSVFISYKAYVILCKMDQAGSCQSLFTATSHVVSPPAVTLSAFTCTADGE